MAARVLCLLPRDLLVHVLSSLDAVSLLAASQSSIYLSSAAADEHVWRALLWHNHASVLTHLFDGRVPRPRDSLTWKQHYFEFIHSWKRLAQQQSGRILLKIHASALGDGVPHGLRDTYSVYDATEYATEHPGLELIVQDAAEEEDSTDAFAAASHSRRACNRLHDLVVPGLDFVKCGGEEATQLALLRVRVRRRRCRAWLLKWGPPSLCLLAAFAMLTPHVIGASPALGAKAHAALTRARARLVPTPAAPWLAAALTVTLALFEWPFEAVGALALVILMLMLRRSGAPGRTERRCSK